MEEAQKRQQPLWHSFVAGATSGLAARVATFPTDTLKARLQIKGAVCSAGDASQYRTTAAAARHILATEGFYKGFYRGFGAVLWGVVPANLAYFGGGSLQQLHRTSLADLLLHCLHNCCCCSVLLQDMRRASASCQHSGA
jgi:hypothetical protein